jgi:iron complex transport system substrate-binding protein
MNAALHLIVLLAALACGVCNAVAHDAPPIVVEHAQGTTEVPANPATVVVYDPAALDTLDALQVEVAGVPAFPLPGALAKYAGDGYAKVGSLFEPDFEAVAALRPDLIIVGGRSAAQYDALSRIAPTIDLTVGADSYLADAEANARTLGRVFGKEAEIEERIAQLDASVAALRAKAADIGTGLIVLTTGNRMSAYGPGSRFGVLHTDFGIAPAVPDLTPATHGEAISFEFVLETNPDWLFVVDRDAAIGRGAAAALLDNELVAETTAWKRDQVVYLDPVRWYLLSGGLRALQESVDQLAAAIAEKRQ